MTKRTLPVAGMSCGHCERSVREELERLGGVSRAEADHKSGSVEVDYDADSVTDEDLRAAVEEAGYSLRI